MKEQETIIIIVFLLLVVISAFVAIISLPIALVLLGGLVIGALVFYKPFYGLMLYIAVFFVRPQDFVPELAPLRIVLVLASILLVSFFIHKIFRREKITVFSTRQHITMFILLLLVPISNIINFHPEDAWEGLNYFLTVFILFFIVVNTVDNFDKFRKICWTLVVFTTVIAVNGLFQKFRGVDLVGRSPAGGRIQWLGFFHDPNDLALLINSFLPFIMVNIFEKDIIFRKKLILLPLAALFMLNLYYTQSRGGYIAFLMILVFLAYKKWGLRKGAGIGMIFLFAAIILAPSRMGQLSMHEASASGRVEAWIEGLVMLKSRPILGIGYQYFTLQHGRAAHSAFIQCMAELGIVGYFIWLTLIWTTFADLLVLEKYAGDPIYRKYSKTFQLSMVGFLASSIFLSQAYNPALYIIIALVTVMTHTLGYRVKHKLVPAPKEILKIAMILASSIVGYKLLAMVYY